jgi:hypothetical protein
MSNTQWGNITWNFLHTFAIQINEKKFHKIRNIAIDLVVLICNNLPCPICRTDATNIINKAYLNNIQTKTHFVEFICQLHNIVNIKLEKTSVNRDEFSDKYKKMNLINIINEFIRIYSVSYHNLRLLNNDYKQQQFIITFKSKLNEILSKLQNN